MERRLEIGEVKTYNYEVKPQDFASFDIGEVHAVMSTFALGREMEWSSRLFVLDVKSDDEEGIGTMLQVEHKSPAMAGAVLCLEAIVSKVKGNEIICTIVVKHNDRLIATGKTGQKIVKKEKLNQIFTSLER